MCLLLSFFLIASRLYDSEIRAKQKAYDFQQMLSLFLSGSVDCGFGEIYEILNRRTPIETFSVIVKLVYLELLSTPSLQRETIYGEKEKQLLNRYILFAAILSGLDKKTKHIKIHR